MGVINLLLLVGQFVLFLWVLSCFVLPAVEFEVERQEKEKREQVWLEEMENLQADLAFLAAQEHKSNPGSGIEGDKIDDVLTTHLVVWEPNAPVPRVVIWRPEGVGKLIAFGSEDDDWDESVSDYGEGDYDRWVRALYESFDEINDPWSMGLLGDDEVGEETTRATWGILFPKGTPVHSCISSDSEFTVPQRESHSSLRARV